VVKGIINITTIAAKRANTPPSLFGIDRKIAYIHRKYHSGLI
jgi:hypothetical protein